MAKLWARSGPSRAELELGKHLRANPQASRAELGSRESSYWVPAWKRLQSVEP